MKQCLNTAPLVAVFLLAFALNAAVIQVPEDQPTIQEALNSILDSDTILVSNGIYAEELNAPDFGFVLIGNVPSDTGLYARPTIDPSSLASPTNRSCLKNLRGDVVIKRMWFRNGSSMFPHDPNTSGGIWNQSGHLTLVECVFDSTYKSVVSVWNPVTLERCEFIPAVGQCVYAANGAVTATDCEFNVVSNDWSTVIGSGGSHIESCRWSGDMGLHDWWLSIYGNDWIVRDNVFGPGGGSYRVLVNIGGGNGQFEDNYFSQIRTRGSLLGFHPNCEGVVEVRRNTIENCVYLDEPFAGPVTVDQHGLRNDRLFGYPLFNGHC